MPEVIDGKLVFGKTFTGEELAKKYGTPLEVMEWDLIDVGKIQRWLKAFETAMQELRGEGYQGPEITYKPKYPLKTHYNTPMIEALFKPNGFGIDATSINEVIYSLNVLDYDPCEVVFTGNNVKRDELEFIRGSGVYPNLESFRAVAIYNELAPGTDVSIRIKPGHLGAGHDPGRDTGKWDAKFGILWPEARKAKDLGSSLNINGLHTHLGSGALDVEPLIERDNFLFALYDLINGVNRFNFGGGIKIPYKRGFPKYHHSFDPEQGEADIEDYARRHVRLAAEWAQKIGKSIEINHENGRWFVAEAGTVLGTITDIKDIPDVATIVAFLEGNPDLKLTDMPQIPYANRKNIGVDFGWENCPREVLYGEQNTPHIIMPVERIDRLPGIVCDISGRICESEIDQGTGRTLPLDIKPEDIIAKLNYGAYGPSSMPFLLYNMYGQMRQVAVYRGEVFETRKPQTVEDMVRNDRRWSGIRLQLPIRQ